MEEENDIDKSMNLEKDPIYQELGEIPLELLDQPMKFY